MKHQSRHFFQSIVKNNLLWVSLSVLLFIWVLARNAWCSDDSFISMRVVDNFVNGYGLVWNPGERVQVFTHPLWLLILIPVYIIKPDPYSTLIWTSLLFSLATYIILITKFAKSPVKIFFTTVCLSLSSAFIDFSSSGLENPLSHLLMILFLWIWFDDVSNLKKLFWLSLVACLATINRYDMILFYFPAIIFSIFIHREKLIKTIGTVILGFLPLVIWELFSLFYYGFLFPNTYYAKLSSANLPPNWLLLHGWKYFETSFIWDPVTLVTIIMALFLMILKLEKKIIIVNIGVILYLGYVFSIGGDFMSGRFLSSAFLVMFAQLISYDYKTVFKDKYKPVILGGVSLLLVLGFISKHPPLFVTRNDVDKTITEFGIANEKLFYFNSASWLNRRDKTPIFKYAKLGLELHESDEKVFVHSAIGFLGYYTGPEVYIVDKYVLPDALRARLIPVKPFRVGHLARNIPEGYIETIEDSFENHIEDPDLHEYYNKLDILIHQDLFTPGRFQEIVNFNIGKYDYLLEKYNDSNE